jgi:coniferyl-aldehyde dehydrogenase
VIADDAEPAVVLQRALTRQRDAALAHPVPSLEERLLDLRALRRFVCENRQAICDAISADYGYRSPRETRLAEIAPTLEDLDHVLGHLTAWIGPRRREPMPQPLGVVGLIVPSTFPLKLSMVPLIFMLAAGNRVMIKMSGNSCHLAQLLVERMPAYLPPEKLQVFAENGTVGALFSALRFDHLLFTGSSEAGRAVMTAAAQNLCPVTMDLGGRSPAIVCGDYPMRAAAERILGSKCLNAGQHWTAIDLAWVPQDRVDEFVRHARDVVAASYSGLDSPEYSSIVDRWSFDRLMSALDDARARGARIEALMPGPAVDRAAGRIAPHLVLGTPEDSALMQHEILGPILPVCPYASLEEVIAQINAGPCPPLIFPLSRDRTIVEMLADRVLSDEVSIENARFVGEGHRPSAETELRMSRYRGRAGLERFSKMRRIAGRAPFEGLRMPRWLIERLSK